jgi:hypothetical protein
MAEVRNTGRSVFMRRSRFSLLLLTLFVLPVAAQQPDVFSVAPDQTAVVLNGPWKFHVDDSPKALGSQTPLWSQPSFNDAAWQPYLLDPKHPNLTAFEAAQSPELPGWQSHGHPAYTGYAW